MCRYMFYNLGVALTRSMGFEKNKLERERLNGIQEVRGSIPRSSTIFYYISYTSIIIPEVELASSFIPLIDLNKVHLSFFESNVNALIPVLFSA